MRDSEVDELCRQIYKMHKRAIDLIAKRVPDNQTIVQQALVKMVEETPGIRLCWHGRSGIEFHPTEWHVPALPYGGGEKAPALILLFYIHSTSNHLKLWLEIREASEERRKHLYDRVVQHGNPFSKRGKPGKTGNVVYSKMIVTRKQMPQLEATEVIAQAYEQFNAFLNDDLPIIKRVLNEEERIWSTRTIGTTERSGVDDAGREENDDEQ